MSTRDCHTCSLLPTLPTLPTFTEYCILHDCMLHSVGIASMLSHWVNPWALELCTIESYLFVQVEYSEIIPTPAFQFQCPGWLLKGRHLTDLWVLLLIETLQRRCITCPQVLRSFDALLGDSLTEEVGNAGIKVIKFSKVISSMCSSFSLPSFPALLQPLYPYSTEVCFKALIWLVELGLM